MFVKDVTIHDFKEDGIEAKKLPYPVRMGNYKRDDCCKASEKFFPLVF
jgi:hypothetical protein